MSGGSPLNKKKQGEQEMIRIRALVVGIVILGLLAILPMAAMAQPTVSGFFGTVSLDGVGVPDGTVVKALIDLVEVKSTTTTNSHYVIYVDSKHTGKTVFFTIGSGAALAGESSLWEAGSNKRVNLIALSVPDAAGEAVIFLSPPQGAVTVVSGQGFTPTAQLTVTWDGQSATVFPAVLSVSNTGSFHAILVAPTSVVGNYTVRAQDDRNLSGQASFTVTDPSKGAKGDTGAEGATGAVGEAGSAGPAGVAGPAGAIGATGADGAAGAKGAKGGTGAKGAQGSAGSAGSAGSDGSSGASTLAIIALVLAVIAVGMAYMFRSKPPSEDEAAA